MADHQEDKTLDPTPHRRQQMRESGQVAHSQDLSSAVVLLGSLGVLVFTGGALLNFLGSTLASQLSGRAWLDNLQAPRAAGPDWVVIQSRTLLEKLATAALPVLGLIVLVAVAISLLQKGLWFLPGRLAPDTSRINPLTGLGRLFSKSSAVQLTFSVLKIVAVAGVAWFTLYNQRHAIAALPALDAPQLALALWKLCLGTCLKVGLALGAFALLDYGYQRLRYEQELKMTPQELREEMRNLQGPPQVLARRRGLQRGRRREE